MWRENNSVWSKLVIDQITGWSHPKIFNNLFFNFNPFSPPSPISNFKFSVILLFSVMDLLNKQTNKLQALDFRGWVKISSSAFCLKRTQKTPSPMKWHCLLRVWARGTVKKGPQEGRARDTRNSVETPSDTTCSRGNYGGSFTAGSCFSALEEAERYGGD